MDIKPDKINKNISGNINVVHVGYINCLLQDLRLTDMEFPSIDMNSGDTEDPRSVVLIWIQALDHQPK